MLDTPKTTQENSYPEEGYKELVDAGLFYGRVKSKTHPRMRQYILVNRNGVEIVNLSKTKEGLDAALDFIKETIKKGGSLLFVATQPPAHGASQFVELGYPAVTRRWLGGTLTNFRIILHRVEYFKKLKTDFANKAFERYTKKERLSIERELVRLEELFHGLTPLKELPSALVVIDPQVHKAAVREARLLHIPVVALTNTDSDPDMVDYVIPGNNKAKMSIEWFFVKVKEAIAEGKRLHATLEAEKEARDKAGEAVKKEVVRANS